LSNKEKGKSKPERNGKESIQPDLKRMQTKVNLAETSLYRFFFINYYIFSTSFIGGVVLVVLAVLAILLAESDILFVLYKIGEEALFVMVSMTILFLASRGPFRCLGDESDNVPSVERYLRYSSVLMSSSSGTVGIFVGSAKLPTLVRVGA
jgi:hypothetical protein